MALTYDIKANGGAVGDGILTTAVLTINEGSTVLQSATPLWHPEDVTKGITVDGIKAHDNTGLATTIAGYTSSTQITLADAAGAALSAQSVKVGWGTNDNPAFVNFNTAGRAASGLVTLNLPAGVYYLNPAGVNSANDSRWCRGIPNLKVVGTGMPTLLGTFKLGALTFPTTNQVSARIASVAAGSTTLQLLTIADYVKFQPGRQLFPTDLTVYTAGTTCIISGIDLIGNGDPNFHYFEWATITNVNSSTGVITLSAPIRNSYLQTWPLYFPGNAGLHTDCGGPATIYMLDASWDATIEHSGYQIFQPQGQTDSPVRTVSYTNGFKWIPGIAALGPNPSNAETYTLNGADFTGCFIEVDKIIGTLNILNSTGHTFWFQSSSTDDLVIDNSTVELKGTPKRTRITNSIVASLKIGAEGYGRADSLYAADSVISSITAVGVIYPDVSHTGFTPDYARMLYDNTLGPVRFAVPGTHMMFSGAKDNVAPMTLGALTGDGSPTTVGNNTFIQTSHPGPGWPTIPLQGGTNFDLVAHPCPALTMINCTGCADARDLSQAGAQGKPIYTYTKRTYLAADLVNPITGPKIWGRIVSVVVTVNVAFTTAGARSLNVFGQFQANAVDPNGTASTWSATIDLKTSGTRTITPTSVTGSAGADSLSAPGNLWFAGEQDPYVSAVINGGDPGSVTVEVQTDQGFGTLVPNLRLHR